MRTWEVYTAQGAAVMLSRTAPMARTADARTRNQVKGLDVIAKTIKLLLAEGDLVAAWTTYEGTQRGPMGPFPPSGRKAKFDFGAVFRIDGGKIAEWWVTWDSMTVLRALGHLPSG